MLVFIIRINNDLLRHKQAKINDKNGRYLDNGVVKTAKRRFLSFIFACLCLYNYPCIEPFDIKPGFH